LSESDSITSHSITEPGEDVVEGREPRPPARRRPKLVAAAVLGTLVAALTGVLVFGATADEGPRERKPAWSDATDAPGDSATPCDCDQLPTPSASVKSER
jgi:hypothetical protein